MHPLGKPDEIPHRNPLPTVANDSSRELPEERLVVDSARKQQRIASVNPIANRRRQPRYNPKVETKCKKYGDTIKGIVRT
jgi:hypothetical protein